MEDTTKSTSNGTGETVTPGSNEQNNNGSNGSEADKTQNNGGTDTVPYGRFKEVNDAKIAAENRIKQLEGKDNTDKTTETPALPNTPEDRVLELVGKVPERLKPFMSEMSKYAKDHNMTVEDTISFFDVKKGNTIPKEKVGEYYEKEKAANDSNTGGSANPAVRNNVETKNLSDAELEAKVKQGFASGDIQ